VSTPPAVSEHESDLLVQMFTAFDALRKTGWREAVYAPKDTPLHLIEAGSTGVFNGTRDETGFLKRMARDGQASPPSKTHAPLMSGEIRASLGEDRQSAGVASDFGLAWTLLTRAHDRLWRDKTLPLKDRSDACDLLWSAVIRLHRAAAAGRVH
jgi:hypothetical protein